MSTHLALTRIPDKYPTSMHWLGERQSKMANPTRHAQDQCGCVLYFETEADCMAFMAWVMQHSKRVG